MTDPITSPTHDSPLPDGQRMPPHPELNQYYTGEKDRRRCLNRWFDTSAQHYDWISQAMSLGTGHRYRREALLRSGLVEGMSVLDVACGTGVIAGHAAQEVGPGGCVVALDPSIGMLREAARSRVRHAIQGVSEHLPVADASVDFVSMGYALRHVTDLCVVFKQYNRVLKPGGDLLILEVTPPRSRVYYYLLKFYMKFVVPTFTMLVSRSRHVGAMMTYNWDTIERCVPPDTIIAALQEAGFKQVNRRVALGIFSEYTAKKV